MNDSRVVAIDQHAEPICDNTLSFDFEERPSSLPKELPPFAPSESALSFGYATASSNCRSAKLRCQAVQLRLRKCSRDLVHSGNEIQRSLEHNKIMN